MTHERGNHDSPNQSLKHKAVKALWMAQTVIDDLAGKDNRHVLHNCTTRIPLKLNLDCIRAHSPEGTE